MKPIFDAHIHTLGACGDVERLTAMLDTIHAQGTDRGVFLASPYKDTLENIISLWMKMTYQPIKLWAFGGLHHSDCFADISYEDQVKAMLDLGCDGIKMMDTFPVVGHCLPHPIDHESYDKMFAYLEENRVPILAHAAGSPRAFSKGGRYDAPGYYPKRAYYEQMYRVLDRFPELNITFAHFFFLSDHYEEAVRVMETYPNVYFDLTPGLEMYPAFSENPEKWHDFFEKYSHRLMFGADVCPHSAHCTEELYTLILDTLTHDHTPFERICYGSVYPLRGLALSEEAVDQICRKTAAEFIQDEPKKVDKKKLGDVINAMIDALKQNPYPKAPLLCEIEESGFPVGTPEENMAVLSQLLQKIS